jgi:hypothetical protein
MKLRTILGISILLSGLISCGNKKSNDDKEPKKDSVVVKNTVKDSSHTTTTVQQNETIVDNEIQIDPNTSPENLVKTLIKAGKTGKYGPILKICNESIDMDGDAKDICNIANASKSHQEEFNDFFGNATIVGKARIKNGIAEVDIETTAEGGEKETIVVQQKYDKWYLKGL